jgi:hypothetical protein
MSDAYNVYTRPTDNHAAKVDPTVNDDASKDFGIGSRWLNQSNHKLWFCYDATKGHAVWHYVQLT